MDNVVVNAQASMLLWSEEGIRDILWARIREAAAMLAAGRDQVTTTELSRSVIPFRHKNIDSYDYHHDFSCSLEDADGVYLTLVMRTEPRAT